jgi:hypothetical protein
MAFAGSDHPSQKTPQASCEKNLNSFSAEEQLNQEAHQVQQKLVVGEKAHKIFLLSNEKTSSSTGQVGTFPSKFRTTLDSGEGEFSRQGLELLNAAGSSQFNQQQFDELMSKNFKGKKVTVVDLREESHAFIDGHPVSWYSFGNSNNHNKSLDSILQDESNRSNALKKDSQVFVQQVVSKGEDEDDPEKWEMKTVSYQPKSILTEKELVQRSGAQYLRIPVADHHGPQDQQVDFFVSRFKNLSQDEWVYFHCAGGKGRTTLFMSMLDMMRTSSKLSLEEILSRQKKLGGTNLLKEKHYQHLERQEANSQKIEFLQKFYKYCREEGPKGFSTPWTQWVYSH